MRTGSLSFYFVTLCLAALGSIHYFLNRGKVGVAYLVRVRGGRGWKGRECSRLREIIAGAKACSGQHHHTLKDPKQGECNEMFPQEMLLERLFMCGGLG